jgi:hypothetical protein
MGTDLKTVFQNLVTLFSNPVTKILHHHRVHVFDGKVFVDEAHTVGHEIKNINDFVQVILHYGPPRLPD